MSICLNSRFPIAVYWGPEYLMLYNESLVPMVGPKKHPQALGQPARVVLAEIWGIIEPLLRQVRTTGDATWSEDLMLPLARTGVPEESYFTFTYSPIRDESERRWRRLLRGRGDHRQGDRRAAAAPAQRARGTARARRRRPRRARSAAAGDRAGAARRRPSRSCICSTTPASPRSPARRTSSRGACLRRARFIPATPAPWRVRCGHRRAASCWPSPMGPGARAARSILPIEHAGGGRRFGFVVAGLSPAACRRAPRTPASTRSSRRAFRKPSAARPPTRTSGSAPRRWQSSTAPRPRSSAT